MRHVSTKKLTVFYTPSFRNFISCAALTPERLIPLMSKLNGFVSFIGDISVLCSISALKSGSDTSKAIVQSMIPQYADLFKDHRTSLRIAEASRVEVRIRHRLNKFDPSDPDRFTVESLFFKEGTTKLALIDMTFTLDGRCCAAGLVATDYL